jgi:Holliday junction resolvase RusA-like endonuclease
MTLYLSGQMVSGKNQIQIACRKGRPCRYPNKRFEAWKQDMSHQILTQLMALPLKDKPQLPLRGDVSLSVSYVPGDRHRRDVSGMADALFHLLEHVGIVEDDYQIKRLYFVTESPQNRKPMALELVVRPCADRGT